MSFTWFSDRPLRSREQVMEIIVRVADDLAMPDKKGACIIAGMTVAVEAGDDETGDNIPEFWCPANPTNDPETLQYEHDSYSDDSRSSGYFQQQPPWWGTAAQRMDPYESCKLFMTSLKRYPYRASNAQEANDWAQRVQGSSHPDRYAKWWQLANDVYNNVTGTPVQGSYGMPPGSNSGGYGGNGVRFPDWVYALGDAFGIKPSTYPGHQETERSYEAGYAPNPLRLNRGIDWTAPGAPDQWDRLTRFADYLATIPQHLEQVIWQNPNTMRSIEVAGGRHQPGYFAATLKDHRNHVHTRQSAPIPLPTEAPMAPSSVTPEPGFTGDPYWLADVLRAEGLNVVEVDGWKQRGQGDQGKLWGVMCHHTGGNNTSVNEIAFHRQLGLASHIHLAKDGTVTVCGIGRANHAGVGDYPGLPSDAANAYTIGIEAVNLPPKGQPHRTGWSNTQYNAYVLVCAAICRKLAVRADRVISHQEWAGRKQGKWDPGSIDMNIMRADVQARIDSFNPINQEDDLTPQESKMLNDLWKVFCEPVETESGYGDPGEGKKWTRAQMIVHNNKFLHEGYVQESAKLGDRDSLDRLFLAADGEGRVTTDNWIERSKNAIDNVPDEIATKYLEDSE